jgi:hypothetical protein
MTRTTPLVKNPFYSTEFRFPILGSELGNRKTALSILSSGDHWETNIAKSVIFICGFPKTWEKRKQQMKISVLG